MTDDWQLDTEIPDHVRERTEALFQVYPPTNPNVLLETAKWWYNNGRGANDPIGHLALGWLLAVHCEYYSQFDTYDLDDDAKAHAEKCGIDTSVE